MNGMISVIPKGRYLVTGGAGFIGSHLCEYLIENGCAVVVADSFITGRRANIRNLLGCERFSVLERNIVDEIDVDGALAGIFHLASPASPADYMKYPIETLRVGARGSDNVLALAMRKRCRALVTSTSEVYGDPEEHPQKESYWGHVNPIGPRSCYDEAKRYLEALTMAYRRAHHVDTRIARIFNTYGPRMRENDGRVVPNFCSQAKDDREITVYGDGSQTRSFCYVSDMVSGLVKLFGSSYAEPVNLGNPNEMSILDFAKTIIKISGSKSKIRYCDLPADDPKVRRPDISVAIKLLGWEPTVSLETGIQRTFDSFRASQG
jgi:dTDP-glucose 4,6-dehydratase